MAVMTVVVLVVAILSGRWQRFAPVTFMLAVLGFYLHNTLRGKFVVWADLLEQLHLRGDERILDLGCGRGAVLLMAAQHLTTGRAVGVDLWRSVDQSGNSLEATRRNAIAEGVADRVELHTGDMTALPFEDNSFDVIVSSLAVHNISGSAGREKAISEAVRVLSGRPVDDRRRSGHAATRGTPRQARDERGCTTSAGVAALVGRDCHQARKSELSQPPSPRLTTIACSEPGDYALFAC
jgi:SAM-dependent methyltransferase